MGRFTDFCRKLGIYCVNLTSHLEFFMHEKDADMEIIDLVLKFFFQLGD